MHNRHLLFVFRSSPYGSGRAREGLDALLAASIFDQQVSALFIGDGVLQLCSEQAPKGSRNQHKMLLSLPLYDVNRVYFSSSALAARKIAATDIRVTGTVLQDAEITQLLTSVDQVLTF
jgi:tRNA 2-thiouridine synthesizing protein C